MLWMCRCWSNSCSWTKIIVDRVLVTWWNPVVLMVLSSSAVRSNISALRVHDFMYHKLCSFTTLFLYISCSFCRVWDAVVVGGGHNGLTAAAYLAKAGLQVAVLERRHVLGGAAVTEEVVPGFKFSRASYLQSLLRPGIIRWALSFFWLKGIE